MNGNVEAALLFGRTKTIEVSEWGSTNNRYVRYWEARSPA